MRPSMEAMATLPMMMMLVFFGGGTIGVVGDDDDAMRRYYLKDVGYSARMPLSHTPLALAW